MLWERPAKPTLQHARSLPDIQPLMACEVNGPVSDGCGGNSYPWVYQRPASSPKARRPVTASRPGSDPDDLVTKVATILEHPVIEHLEPVASVVLLER